MRPEDINDNNKCANEIWIWYIRAVLTYFISTRMSLYMKRIHWINGSPLLCQMHTHTHTPRAEEQRKHNNNDKLPFGIGSRQNLKYHTVFDEFISAREPRPTRGTQAAAKPRECTRQPKMWTPGNVCTSMPENSENTIYEIICSSILFVRFMAWCDYMARYEIQTYAHSRAIAERDWANGIRSWRDARARRAQIKFDWNEIFGSLETFKWSNSRAFSLRALLTPFHRRHIRRKADAKISYSVAGYN